MRINVSAGLAGLGLSLDDGGRSFRRIFRHDRQFTLRVDLIFGTVQLGERFGYFDGLVNAATLVEISVAGNRGKDLGSFVENGRFTLRQRDLGFSLVGSYLHLTCSPCG